MSVYGSDFVVFGGFVNGSRVNEVFHLQATNKPSLSWALLPFEKAKSPIPRNSHTSVVDGDSLVIFGG